MGIVDDTTLKSYYETGDTPTQAEFASFIDSKTHVNVTSVVYDTANIGNAHSVVVGNPHNTTASNVGIFIGKIQSTGSYSSFPVGWTASKLSTGQYQIIHGLNDTSYAVALTPSSANVVVYRYQIAANMTNITVQNMLTGAVADGGFDFILVRA